jgi:hypothetical protein
MDNKIKVRVMKRIVEQISTREFVAVTMNDIYDCFCVETEMFTMKFKKEFESNLNKTGLNLKTLRKYLNKHLKKEFRHNSHKTHNILLWLDEKYNNNY